MWVGRNKTFQLGCNCFINCLIGIVDIDSIIGLSGTTIRILVVVQIN